MRVPMILGVLVASVAGSQVVAAVVSRRSDEAAVREAVNHYLQGHATGDGAHFRLVFHPDSKLFWIDGDTLRQRTSADYIAGAPGKPAPDEARRKRRIEKIDVTGNAAVAKVVLDYPDNLLTDYLSLLEINGKWKIVNKIFVREGRTAG